MFFIIIIIIIKYGYGINNIPYTIGLMFNVNMGKILGSGLFCKIWKLCHYIDCPENAFLSSQGVYTSCNLFRNCQHVYMEYMKQIRWTQQKSNFKVLDVVSQSEKSIKALERSKWNLSDFYADTTDSWLSRRGREKLRSTVWNISIIVLWSKGRNLKYGGIVAIRRVPLEFGWYYICDTKVSY